MGLVEIGGELLDKGYEIVPIVARGKRPTETGWTTTDYDRAWFDKASVNGSADCGVGIKAKYTPGADIDTTIVSLQQDMFDFLWDNYGADIIRWGRRPLVMFRCEVPFKKVSSAKFFDENGEKHQLEFLAEGQQFVTGGLHQETLKEYRMNGEIPHHDELPLITEEDARIITEHFEMLARQVDGLVESGATRSGGGDGSAKLPLNLADWQVRDYLASSGIDVDDYDEWLRVGMALYHQYDGGQGGYDIWVHWSQKSNKYRGEEMEQKWYSFSGRSDGITFRSVIKICKDNARELSREVKGEVLEQLKFCTVADEILDTILPNYQGKLTDIELEIVAQTAKQRYKDISGITISIAVTRGLLREHSEPQEEASTTWTQGWYYLLEDNKFMYAPNSSIIGVNAFDMLHAGYIARGEGNASKFAVSRGMVQSVNNCMYMPGEAGTFFWDSKEYLNLYREHHLPTQAYNQEAVDVFLEHCKVLIPDDRERAIFISFLSHVIKHPGDKIKWGVMLQGPPGNGKTYFQVIMELILGEANVDSVNSDEVTNGSFNEWVQGKLFTVLNELKMNGHNRHDAFNRLKAPLTDDVVSVNIKGLRRKKVVNCTNYLITTNFTDSAPIDDTDRRIFVIFSEGLQDTAYYDRLFDTSRANPWSIREFLLNYEPHPEFVPKSRAPITIHKQVAIQDNKSSIQVFIEEYIEDGDNKLITKDYVSITAVRLALETEGHGKVKPENISYQLKKMGYSRIGRMRYQGDKHRFWGRKGCGPIEEVKEKLAE